MCPRTHIVRITHLPIAVKRMKTANIQNQIKRCFKIARRQNIGGAKLDTNVSLLRFASRRINRARHIVHANYIKAMLREIQRVCACSASQIQRAPRRKLFLFNQRDDFGRRDIGIPGRLARPIPPLIKQSHDREHHTRHLITRTPRASVLRSWSMKIFSLAPNFWSA